MTPPPVPSPAATTGPDALPPTHVDVEALRRRVADAFPGIRADLESLVTIPSISSLPEHHADVARSAERVAELLRGTGAGFDSVEIVRATVDGPDGPHTGMPAVLASKAAPAGRPTVLLYAHHDVQPLGPREDWDSEPLVCTERDGRLYGRGASDDKAGVLAHVGALRVLADELNVGVKLFVEGEEEDGSPTFARILAEHRDELVADVIVVADSGNWTTEVPALTATLRGAVHMTVEVATLDHAVHSGQFGGPVLDAVTALVRLLATLHDEAGDVAVPGLVATDAPELDYDEARYRAEAGVLEGTELVGTGSVLSRLWTHPALTVTGIDAPDVAHASNTLHPRARAALSMRIAPGQDPAEAARLLREHLLAHAPFGAKVTILGWDEGAPFSVDLAGRAAALEHWALAEAFGTPAVDAGMGGSIPFLADFHELFPEAQILVTGVEDPDSRAHSANESLDLESYRRAVLAEVLLLARLGEIDVP